MECEKVGRELSRPCVDVKRVLQFHSVDKRSKRLFDRKRKKRKNTFLLTTGTVVQRTMLHTYVLTALYEPRVLHHRARCLFLVLYGSNRRLIGYSGVLRSDYAVLVVCPEYLQNGPTRHGASFHGTASMTNVKSIGRVTWTAISNWPNVCTCFAILGF